MNLQKMEVWKITSFLKGVILGSSSRLVLGKTHTFESRTFVLFQVGFLLSNVSNHYCINPTMWETCMENIYIFPRFPKHLRNKSIWVCGPLPVAVANEGLAWNNPGCHYYWKEAAPANVYICIYMVVHENTVFLLIDVHTFCRLKPSKTKGWLVQFLGKSLPQEKKGAWLNRNWWRSRLGRIANGVRSLQSPRLVVTYQSKDH